MTQEEISILKRSVAFYVKRILLKSTFADNDICATNKICDLTTFGDADIKLIKEGINSRFDLDIKEDISDFSVGQLFNIVFTHVSDSEDLTNKFLRLAEKNNIKLPSKRTNQPTQPIKPSAKKDTRETNEKHLLNSHEVFAIVLSTLGELLRRRIYPTERVKKLVNEFIQNEKKSVKNQEYFIQNGEKIFSDKLVTALQNKFHENLEIKIDTVSNPKMGIYSITTQTTNALINCGKAIDPKVECAGMHPIWILLRTAMTFDTVVNILWEDFGIWTSTKTISTLGSYAEYEKYVTKLMVRNKINQIIFDSDKIPDKACQRKELFDTLISSQNAESITQNVQNIFNITVDYDISDTKLDELYNYVYKQVAESQELRNRLFGKTDTQPIKTVVNETNEPMQAREDIFSDIIRRVNKTISLKTSVQGETNVYNLLKNLPNKRRNTLRQLLRELENEYDIKINTTDSKLTIRSICNEIHNTLVQQGKSVSIRIPPEEMDPLWRVLHLAINSAHLKDVIRIEMGINISAYKLENQRSYQDIENLIITTQLIKGMEK